MNQTIHDRALSIFRFIDKTFDLGVEKAIEEGQTRFTGTIGHFFVSKEIATIWQFLQEGEDEIAYTNAFNALKNIVVEFKLKDKDFNQKSLNEAADFYRFAANEISFYESWFEEDQKALLDALFQNPLLDPSERIDFEKTSKVSRKDIGEVKQAMSKLKGSTRAQFRTYLLVKANDKPFDCSKQYTINSNFIAADNFDLLKQGALSTDDTVKITICMKIEPHVDFSYFCFFVSQNSNIWLASDFIQFDNPGQADRLARRSAAKYSESRYDSIPLPYKVIDDIIEWRKDSKDIAKEGTKVGELYAKPVREYLPFGARVTLSVFVDFIVNEIQTTQFGFERIGTAAHLAETSQLLLGSSADITVDDERNVFSSINYEQSQKYYEQLAIQDNEDKSSLLPAVPMKELVSQKAVKDQMLMTEKVFKDSIIWERARQEANKVQELLDKGEENEGAQKAVIYKFFERFWRSDLFRSIVFSGEKVYFVSEHTQDIHTFGTDHVNGPTLHLLANKQTISFPYLSLFYDSTSSAYKHQINCVDCRKYKTKSATLTVQIGHWHELCALFGIERSQLPPLFQNYAKYSFIPYHGNDLLDNTNPKFQVRSRFAEHHPNGLNVGFHICGLCLRRLYSQYKKAEETVVLQHKDNSIEILSKEEFTEKFGT